MDEKQNRVHHGGIRPVRLVVLAEEVVSKYPFEKPNAATHLLEQVKELERYTQGREKVTLMVYR